MTEYVIRRARPEHTGYIKKTWQAQLQRNASRAEQHLGFHAVAGELVASALGGVVVRGDAGETRYDTVAFEAWAKERAPNGVIGFAVGTPNAVRNRGGVGGLLVHMVYVTERFRGQGVATNLLRAFGDAVESSHVVIGTEVRSKSLQKYFDHKGWEHAPRAVLFRELYGFLQKG